MSKLVIELYSVSVSAVSFYLSKKSISTAKSGIKSRIKSKEGKGLIWQQNWLLFALGQNIGNKHCCIIFIIFSLPELWIMIPQMKNLC